MRISKDPEDYRYAPSPERREAVDRWSTIVLHTAIAAIWAFVTYRWAADDGGALWALFVVCAALCLGWIARGVRQRFQPK